MENKYITVEVVYAKSEKQTLLALQVIEGTTIQQAIELSGILAQYPEINLQQNKVGIFSKICSLETVLRIGDRVEIYRALLADPKEIRKQRAAEGKVMKKGAGGLNK